MCHGQGIGTSPLRTAGRCAMAAARNKGTEHAGMRRVAIFGLVVAAVLFGCVRFAEHAARSFERLLVDRVQNGLAVLGLDWADVRADGLRVELRGHAPDIYARDLALESARATARPARVADLMTASLAPPPVREPVRFELLRDDATLTLTGRFAGEPMRQRLMAGLAALAPRLEVHDLTGINAQRPGADWGAEIDIAVLAAARVSNAFVRVEPGAVRVEGLARDADHRIELSEELLAVAGDQVRLDLQLRRPLGIAAPYVFSAVRDVAGGIHVEACTSRDYEEEAAIEAMLNRADVAVGTARCPVALGGPSGDWKAAVAAGLQALSELPAGRFRLEYHDAQLEGVPPTGAAEFEAALARLIAALPDSYRVLGNLGKLAQSPSDQATVYWMRMELAGGAVFLGGQVPDPASQRVIETYAAARFGSGGVRSSLTVASAAAPAGWQAAAMVALDILGEVDRGSAEIAEGRIAVQGNVPGPASAGRLHRLLAGEAPSGYETETEFRIDLPALAAATPKNPGRCAAELGATVAAEPVEFAPGSAVIEASSRPALDRLGAIFARCAGGRFEIAGHTDDRGSEELNLRLSQARADAVLDALITRGVPLGRLAAVGYGETQPVAPNDSESGRARNRRIEFRVIGE